MTARDTAASSASKSKSKPTIDFVLFCSTTSEYLPVLQPMSQAQARGKAFRKLRDEVTLPFLFPFGIGIVADAVVVPFAFR
jgi:hypothetical protein